MPAATPRKLTAEHKKAISLLKAGTPRKQVEIVMSWSRDKLHALIMGDEKKGSKAATLFKEALGFDSKKKKPVPGSELDNKAKLLLKENKRLALSKLNQRLTSLIPHTPTQKMCAELCSILKVLSAATPTFEIKGDMHTHYHLTKEERSNEFRRLLGKATEGIGRRVPDPS